MTRFRSVSYTHLDVYKRQVLDTPSDRGEAGSVKTASGGVPAEAAVWALYDTRVRVWVWRDCKDVYKRQVYTSSHFGDAVGHYIKKIRKKGVEIVGGRAVIMKHMTMGNAILKASSAIFAKEMCIRDSF